jgi:hypothetical protein
MSSLLVVLLADAQLVLEMVLRAADTSIINQALELALALTADKRDSNSNSTQLACAQHSLTPSLAHTHTHIHYTHAVTYPPTQPLRLVDTHKYTHTNKRYIPRSLARSLTHSPCLQAVRHGHHLDVVQRRVSECATGHRGAHLLAVALVEVHHAQRRRRPAGHLRELGEGSGRIDE